MEIVREIRRWGNSAGILLPKEWLGNRARVILVNRGLEIRKEVLNILEPYLEDILGIYLIGSYARGEEKTNSDIDIVVISKNTSKNVRSGKYDISIVRLDSIKKTIESDPILILPRLKEAKIILNKSLLDELVNVKVKKNSFKEFIEDSKRIIKINKEFINLDREQRFDYLDSISIIYSVILRLRGIFIINTLLKNKKYIKKEFIKWIEKEVGKKETAVVYNIYEDIRDNRKVTEKVKIEIAEKLLNLLEKEIKKLQ